MNSRGCWLALFAGCSMLAQTAPPPMVYLRPIALDAAGQPVRDLFAEDFQISDQGKPQHIFFFRQPGEPLSSLGPGDYSNRPGGIAPHTTAILFDLMNESDPNRVDTSRVLAESIPQVHPGGPLYVYFLNLSGDLVPVHAIGTEPVGDSTWLKTFGAELENSFNALNRARPAGIDREDRVKRTYHALEVLASQLAALPGLSDLLWITDHMPVVTNSAPCSGDWVECGLYVAHTAVTLEQDRVSVNPASFSGVVEPSTSYDLEKIAELTGGRTYIGLPVAEVLRQIARNAASAYEIAYVPSARDWDSRFHKIRVTCERKGVKIRVKTRYYALPDSRSAEDRQKDVLQAAYYRPSDVPDIGLRVEAESTAQGMHLEIRIDPADILLSRRNGRFSGALTIVLSARSTADHVPSGGLQSRPLGDPLASYANLNLTGEELVAATKNGIPISRDYAIPAATGRMRVLVLDRNTGRLGSLTFPLH